MHYFLPHGNNQYQHIGPRPKEISEQQKLTYLQNNAEAIKEIDNHFNFQSRLLNFHILHTS